MFNPTASADDFWRCLYSDAASSSGRSGRL